MNWKRGITRLLIILFPVAGLVAFLIQAEGERWDFIRGTIVIFPMFLLMGLGGYLALRLLQLIVYLFRWVLNMEKRKGGKIRIDLKKEFRELTLISAVISSAVLFFLSLAIDTKGVDPDYFIAWVFSFVVFIVAFGLVWAVYAIIMFIIRGFIGDGLKAMPISENKSDE
ncbi:MAG: hypothetical protein WC476_03235 [Phycisphaerae bacterium]|jgi:MFS family permease